MTIASRMRLERQDDGRQILVGSLLHDFPKGTLIHLARTGDDYELRAIEPRMGDRSRESLWSFIEPTINELKQMGLFTT